MVEMIASDSEHGREGDSARAKNPSPVFKTGLGFSARLNEPENLKKISCNQNGISARAEK